LISSRSDEPRASRRAILRQLLSRFVKTPKAYIADSEGEPLAVAQVADDLHGRVDPRRLEVAHALLPERVVDAVLAGEMVVADDVQLAVARLVDRRRRSCRT
jgi:hypothetical protein